MQKTSEQIQANVDQVMNVIAEASGGAEHYGNVLQSQAGGLDENTSADEMQVFIKTIMQETGAMVAQNKALQSQLEQSSAEIEDLRSDLETVQNEALTDRLAEIANRKKFDLSMLEASRTAMSTGQPLCLFMTDIDHFKKFNDTYGHETGDQVLRLVAAILRKTITGDDLGNITVSIGVALYRPGEALTDFIKRADDGLYYAKNTGRNQVVPETKLSNAAE